MIWFAIALASRLLILVTAIMLMIVAVCYMLIVDLRWHGNDWLDSKVESMLTFVVGFDRVNKYTWRGFVTGKGE